jgi:hypothetical protein
MRLWSIHPKYLDVKGLTGLWREALHARKVLQGRTKGYKNHPQLTRFKQQKDPIRYINSYLYFIYKESCSRGYCFDKRKLGKKTSKNIEVTKGQIEYEFKHLKKKLKTRHNEKYKELLKIKKIQPNPLFKIKKGSIEAWEKV